MSDNFDLKKYLIENKVTTNSKMLNEDWTEPEGGLIDSAAKSFPQLVKKYGLEAVKIAFDIIYENTYGYAIENRADEEEAEKYAEKEILEKVEDFKKDPTDLENLIIDTLADMEADNGMTEMKKKHSKMMNKHADKIVKEAMHGGYLEIFEMNPTFEEGVANLLQAWNEWKSGEATEPYMVEEAKQDILAYLTSMMK